MTIRAYHHANGDHQRDITIVPSSAHGTNPASAVMAGMKVVVTRCDDNGNIDLDDLRENVEKNGNPLPPLLFTLPPTNGSHKKIIKKTVKLINQHGGLFYLYGSIRIQKIGCTSP